MVYIEKKIIRGKTYLYLVIKAKVDGKVKRIWQKYLGTEDNFQKKVETLKLQLYDNYTITTVDFGLSVALWQIAQKLQLSDIIDNVCDKRSQGMSVGQYLMLAIINRCTKPKSKRKLGTWLEKTYLKELLPVPATNEHSMSMAYTNHFEYLTDERINLIQLLLNERLKTTFGVEMDQLFYDPTNFFTYINPRRPDTQLLPRHGKSKDGKRVLNLISLSVVCTIDGGLPIIHQVYPGNVQDAEHFKSQHRQILSQLKSLNLEPEKVSLVFDKGNISEETFKGIDKASLRFICSVRPSSHKDLNDLTEEDFEMVKLPNGKKVGIKEYQRVLHGQERRLIFCYNPNRQAWSSKIKRSKLAKRIASVEQWFDTRLNTHKWRSKDNVEKKILDLIGKKFLPYVHYKVEKDEQGHISYSMDINEGIFDEEIAKLGKSYLMTNHIDLSAKDVVWTFRQQFTVERVFSYLKGQPNAIKVRPIFHHKDSSIRGHLFSCIIGLLLMMLLQRKVNSYFPNLELDEILDALKDIQMAYITFPEGNPKSKMVTNSDLAGKLLKKLKLKKFVVNKS